jgi:hypothetical protein
MDRAYRGQTCARAHDMPALNRKPEEINAYTLDLIAGLQTIPVAELVACARRGLTATRRIRLSKDDPDGIEEPDHAAQQKALAFIAEQTGGKAGQRILPAAPASDQGKPSPGMLRKGKGATSGSGEGESPTTKGGA